MNVVSNFAYFGFTSLAMAIYVPFLVHNLGVAVYGIVPLAHVATTYLSTFTDGLNVAVSRYLSISVLSGDDDGANRIFNTALVVSLGTIALLFPLGITLAWLFPTLFHVPAGYEWQARILFGCVILTFMITVLDSNFSTSTMIFHRFDLRNVVRGLTMFVRMGTVVLLFASTTPALWAIGLGFVFSAIVSIAGNVWLWRRLTPMLALSLRAADRSRMAELFNFGGWAVVNRVGMLLFLSTDLIVLNRYFGPSVAGQYGTLLLFPELIRNFVETVTGVLSPAIMARFAANDAEGLRRLTVRAVKMLSIGLSVPVGLVCGLAAPFLVLWLGPDFGHLDILFALLVGHLVVTLSTLPLSFALTAYNKVKIQGIVTLGLGALNICTTITVAHFGLGGAAGVAAATAALLTLRSMGFLAVFSARVLKVGVWRLCGSLMAGAASALFVGSATMVITTRWWPSGWLDLFVMGGILASAFGTVSFFLLFSKADRAFVFSLLPTGPKRPLDRN